MGFFNQSNAQRPTSQDVQREIDDISANTARYIQQAGVNIPKEIQNDPRAMCMHLLNSGQVAAPRLRFAQPLINQLLGRK